MTCSSNAYVTPSGPCSCKTGFYEIQSSSLTCGACHSSCQTCSGPNASDCLTCPSYSQVILYGVCTTPPCPAGMYADSTSICQTCDVSCANCTASSSFGCSVCAANYHFESTKCTVNSCGTGYFANLVTGRCDSCPPNCDQCTSSTVCTICSGRFTNTNGVCSCGTGFRLQGTLCVEICGDGANYMTFSNECDDGNTVSGDGCSSDCTAEYGWLCVGLFPDTCTLYINATAVPTATLTVTADNDLLFQVSKELMSNLTTADFSIYLENDLPFTYNFTMGNYSFYYFNLSFSQSFDSGTQVVLSLLNPTTIMDSIHQQINQSKYTGELSRVEVWTSSDRSTTNTMLYAFHGLMAGFGVTTGLLGIQHFFWEFWTATTMYSFTALMNIDPPSLLADYMRYVIPFSWIRSFINQDRVDTTGQSSYSSAKAYGLPASIFLINAVHVVLVIAFLILLYLAIFPGLAFKSGAVRDFVIKLGQLFVYSIPLRAFSIFVLELSIYVYIQLRTASFQTFFIIFNYITACLMGVGLVGVAVWQVSFITRNWGLMRGRQEDSVFFRRFRVLFFELKENSTLGVYSLEVIQLARKVAYLVTLIAFDSVPLVQLIVNAGHSLGFIVWVLVVRPYDIGMQAGYVVILELLPMVGYGFGFALLKQTTVAQRLKLTQYVLYPPLALAAAAFAYSIAFYFIRKSKYKATYEPTPMPKSLEQKDNGKVYDDDYEYWANADKLTADRRPDQLRNAEIEDHPVVFFKGPKQGGVTWLPKKFEKATALDTKD